MSGVASKRHTLIFLRRARALRLFAWAKLSKTNIAEPSPWHDSISVLVERAAGFLRFVSPLGEHSHRRISRHYDFAIKCIAASR